MTWVGLATVLKGERARQVTFTIIETFFKVRELKRELLDLHKETDKQKQQSKMQHFGEVLTDIAVAEKQHNPCRYRRKCLLLQPISQNRRNNYG